MFFSLKLKFVFHLSKILAADFIYLPITALSTNFDEASRTFYQK